MPWMIWGVPIPFHIALKVRLPCSNSCQRNPSVSLILGTGGGRLLGLVKAARPDVDFVGQDFSESMLETLWNRFVADPRVSVEAYDLSEALPDLGKFDVVMSSFAICHLPHERERTRCNQLAYFATWSSWHRQLNTCTTSFFIS